MSGRSLRPLSQRIFGRFLHKLARTSPGATSVRPWLHKLRGVKVGRRVFIGEEVFIDNEYPHHVEIHDDVQISIRVILVAHTRGPGRLIIEKGVFIGPNSVVVCGAGRVLKIGEGVVIGAGSVITKSIPARLYVAPPAPQPLARVNVPLPLAESMEQFWSGLVPLDRSRTGHGLESTSSRKE